MGNLHLQLKMDNENTQRGISQRIDRIIQNQPLK